MMEDALDSLLAEIFDRIPREDRSTDIMMLDFKRAVCEEAPAVLEQLHDCLSESNGEKRRNLLNALKQYLIELVFYLTPPLPGLKELLYDARQHLQQTIPTDYRIAWDDELIDEGTSCETLRAAVGKLLFVVNNLVKLPPQELTCESVNRRLLQLDPGTFIRCCTASNVELKRAEYVNGRAQLEAPPKPKKRKRARRQRAGGKAVRPLTERQSEALILHGECEGNIAEIGRRMGIGRKAASDHLRAALRKVGDSIQLQKPKTKSIPTGKRGEAVVSIDDDKRR